MTFPLVDSDNGGILPGVRDLTLFSTEGEEFGKLWSPIFNTSLGIESSTGAFLFFRVLMAHELFKSGTQV